MLTSSVQEFGTMNRYLMLGTSLAPPWKVVRDLLADYALSLVLDYGASPVETPVMYDLADKAIFEHADKFGERQYRFKSGNRSMMLRFAACFGMFTTMRSMHISPNHLPMKMYELSTYSFRMTDG